MKDLLISIPCYKTSEDSRSGFESLCLGLADRNILAQMVLITDGVDLALERRLANWKESLGELKGIEVKVIGSEFKIGQHYTTFLGWHASEEAFRYYASFDDDFKVDSNALLVWIKSRLMEQLEAPAVWYAIPLKSKVYHWRSNILWNAARLFRTHKMSFHPSTIRLMNRFAFEKLSVAGKRYFWLLEELVWTNIDSESVIADEVKYRAFDYNISHTRYSLTSKAWILAEHLYHYSSLYALILVALVMLGGKPLRWSIFVLIILHILSIIKSGNSFQRMIMQIKKAP